MNRVARARPGRHLQGNSEMALPGSRSGPSSRMAGPGRPWSSALTVQDLGHYRRPAT